MPRTYQVHFSSAADNVGTNNHPRWILDGQIRAKRFRVVKVNFPISFYTSIIRSDAAAATFSSPGFANLSLSIEALGFRTIDEFNAYFCQQVNTLASAWTGNFTMTSGYDENAALSWFEVFSDQNEVEKVSAFDITVHNFDLADLLGVPPKSVLHFTHRGDDQLALTSYTLGVETKTITPKITPGTYSGAGIGEATSKYFMPFVPSIAGSSFLYLRSDSMAEKTNPQGNNMVTGSGIRNSKNIIEAIQIRQPFGQFQSDDFFQSSQYNLAAQQTPMNEFDFYFTREGFRRNLTEAEKIVDFNGRPWSLTLEFQECMCPKYSHDDCDGV